MFISRLVDTVAGTIMAGQGGGHRASQGRRIRDSHGEGCRDQRTSRSGGGGRGGAKRIQMVAGAREPGGGRRAMPHTPTRQAATTAGPRCSNHPR